MKVQAMWLASGLLLTDLIFAILYVVHERTGLMSPWFVNLGMEQGLPECFQYVKEFSAAVLLLLLWFRTKRLVFLATVPVFVLFLIDDSLQIHERAGWWYAKWFSIPAVWGMRGRDPGEIFQFIIYGLMLLPLLMLAYWRSDRAGRRFLHVIFAAIAGLAACGVVADVLPFILGQFKITFGVIDDAGEMVIMSLVLSYIYYLWGEAREVKSVPRANAVPAVAAQRAGV